VSSAEPCTILPWDTEFWGVRIGRVEGGDLTGERAAEVDAWATANEVACLYFRAGEEPSTAHAAENAGFRFMDVRVELTRPSATRAPDGRIRPVEPGDLDELREIARTSHRITRFYADPRFPRNRCDELYETWITQSAEGWADVVLVAQHDGVAAGYTSCHVDEAQGRGSIGLVGVAEHARGSGLGAALVDAGIDWCARRGLDEVAVVTQGRSARALRLYERCGFAAGALGLWFHKWYRP
jgi:dTDP-4-amino-4,6-dideoxy-D-galactose acyltransferase